MFTRALLSSRLVFPKSIDPKAASKSTPPSSGTTASVKCMFAMMKRRGKGGERESEKIFVDGRNETLPHIHMYECVDGLPRCGVGGESDSLIRIGQPCGPYPCYPGFSQRADLPNMRPECGDAMHEMGIERGAAEMLIKYRRSVVVDGLLVVETSVGERGRRGGGQRRGYESNSRSTYARGRNCRTATSRTRRF